MRAIGLVTGVSAVVLGTVVLLLWSMGSSAAEREPFSTERMVPRDVDLYVALNTAPTSSQWIAFSNVLDTVSVQDPLRDAWDDLLSEVDVDWDEDVVSLLGDEAYIAITDFGLLEENRGVVGVAQLRSDGKAEDLFLRLVEEADEEDEVELLEDEYQGVTIYYVEGEGIFDSLSFDEQYEYDEDYDFEEDYDYEGDFFAQEEEVVDQGAIAFVDGLAVFGTSRQDVHGVLDVIAGRAPNVTENARVQELRLKQQEDFLLWGYADLGAAWDELEEYVNEHEDDDTFGESFDPGKLFDDLRENADRLSLTVRARGDGFVIDTDVLRAPGAAAGSDYTLDTVFDSHYADEVPADTLFFAAGYDLYNEIYVPLYDAIADVELNFDSPYCSGAFGPSTFFPSSGEYAEGDDPVYGQFYDENGNFDDEAYEAWEAELEARFTEADGSTDYDAYYDYLDQLYADACAETAQTFAELIEEFEQDAGFDLENDLLSLMTGEFAFALDASNFQDDEPEVRVLGLVDIVDAARVSRSMELVDEYAVREDDWESSVDGDIHLLTPPDEDEDLAWAVDGDSLVLGYPDAPVRDFVGGLQGESLADQRDWKTTMALLPQDTTFVAYVSLARLIEEVRELEDVEDDLDDATNGEVTFDDLKPIRSLGIATAPIEGGFTTRVVVLVDD